MLMFRTEKGFSPLLVLSPTRRGCPKSLLFPNSPPASTHHKHHRLLVTTPTTAKKGPFVILNASEESYTIDRSPLYLSCVYIARRRFFALLRMTKRVFPTTMVTTPTTAKRYNTHQKALKNNIQSTFSLNEMPIFTIS